MSNNKAKLSTLVLILGVFILLSTVGMMTLIKDKQELQRQMEDLTVINSRITEMNDNLTRVNQSLEDDLWIQKTNMEKFSVELESIKTQVTDLTSQNTKLQAELEDSRKTNKALQTQVTKYKEASKKTPTTVSRGEQPSGKEVYVSATAYTAYCNGCSGTTATGVNLRTNPDVKVIAVDPKVIPLGSKVHVEGYGYAIASDTGGAIKGNKIDVFIPGQKSALAWGRKQVKVTILK